MSAQPAATPAGRFGPFGGRYVSETLIPSLDELVQAWAAASADPAYNEELGRLLTDYVGRPTPLWFAARLSAEAEKKPLEPQQRLDAWHQKEVLCVATFPSGGLFATGGADGKVKLAKLGSREPLREETFPGSVRALAFTADGLRLLVATDKSLEVILLETPAEAVAKGEREI